MTTIVTRQGKGSPLSWVEADANFTNLNTDKAETTVTDSLTAAVALKAPLASPTFTGTVSGITKAMVGLSNVDNTSDASKNSSIATLTNKTIVVSGNVVTTASGVNLTSTELNAALAELALKIIPVGTIIDFAGVSAPSGFLTCPTTQTNISRTTYAALFAVLGTTWGVGDGTTTFGMPWFPVDNPAIQANGNVGTTSIGNIPNHNHAIVTVGAPGSGGGTGMVSTNTGSVQGTITSYITEAGTGTQNLPAGVRMLKCIKT